MSRYLSRHKVSSRLRKNIYVRSAIAILLIVLVWIAGAHSFKTSWGFFSNFFGSISDLQNIFAPQAALFSAISAFCIVATFYYQIKQFSVQSFESNFMNMLNMHVLTRSEITYPFEKQRPHNGLCVPQDAPPTSGASAFIDYYNLYHAVCAKYNTLFAPGKEFYLNDAFSRDIEDQMGMLMERDPFPPPQNELFEISHLEFDSLTERRLWHYYKQLYRLIKYTDENAPKEKKGEYLGIIRANLSVHEHAMVYYNALMVKDYELGGGTKPKFQSLIERTSMLHNFPKEMLFDNHVAGKYEQSAFDNNL